MKKRLLAAGCMAILPLVALFSTQNAGAQAPNAAASAAPVPAPTAITERAFLTQYCVVCHNQKAKAAGQPAALAITFDNLDVAHVEQAAAQWERAVRQLRSG